MTIWRYSLALGGINNVKMPKGGKILCVQSKHDLPCIWVELDSTEKDEEVRQIGIVGTGQEFDWEAGEKKYLGTFQMDGGDFIFHAYELL